MRFSIRSTVPLLVLIPGLASACWEQAAKKHNVPTVLLLAIADTESGMNPAAVNNSHVRRTKTVDIGYMQVNSNARMLRNLKAIFVQQQEHTRALDAVERIILLAPDAPDEEAWLRSQRQHAIIRIRHA